MLEKIFFKDNEFKLVKTGKKYSVFFTNSLQLYDIKDKIILDYFDCCTKKTYDDFDKEIADIIKKKFNNVIKKNIKPEKLLGAEEKLNTLVLALTENCNLRCSYCVAYKGENSKCLDMDFSTAKTAIDLLLKNNPDSENYGIIFFGGEPLLNYNLIKEIVIYAQNLFSKYNKSVGFSITTNGTLINTKIINLFKEYNFSIQISFDGPKEIHDKNRCYANGKGSFDKILKNFKKIKDNNIKFILRTTMPVNSNLYEIIKFMEELNISFSFGFTMNTKYKLKNITDYLNEIYKEFSILYEKLMDFYFDKFLKGEQIYCNNIMRSLEAIENQYAKNINCTAGRTVVTVNPSGEIYSCQNVQNYKETKICSINSAISKLNNNKFVAPKVEKINICNKCWVKYLCGGGCFYEKYADNNDIYKPSQSKCEITKIQWENNLKLFQKLKNNHIPIFSENYVPILEYENH